MKKAVIQLIACCVLLFLSMPAYADSDVEVASKKDVSGSYESDLDFLEEEIEEEGTPVPDPLYYFNLGMYHFNDTLYYGFLMPVSTGYAAVLPEAPRRGVRNFFNNLMTPLRVTGCLLQAKVDDAGREMVRFMVNTTAGFAGFRDVAANDLDLQIKDEDIGQALGSYGIGEGFYLVLPFLGPSNLRDAVGGFAGRYVTPTTYIEPFLLSAGVSGLQVVNSTSFVLGKYESIQEGAIEPYEAFKDLYTQYRRNKVSE